MKKEVIIAIIIGISLGTIITFGFHTAQKSINQHNQNKDNPANPTPSVQTPDTPSHSLSVNSPQSEEIIATKTAKVTGITSPESMISVINDAGQAVAVADDKGNFEVSIDLIVGANQTIIKSFNVDGQEASQTIIIVHSDTDLENLGVEEDNLSEDETEEEESQDETE